MPPAPIWHIQLFGVLQVTIGETTITKFRTQATGLLLARLALRNGRPMPRETLADEIFPEMDAKSGRLQLNIALYALRKISPDTPLIISDRFNISLDPKFFETDVAAFETALKNARRATDPTERMALLEQASNLYSDELLVAHHREWIFPERQRLQNTFDEAALELKRLQASPQRTLRVLPAIASEPQLSPISSATNPIEGLPPTFTRFFGRDTDAAELVRRLTDTTETAPLITVIGTGGIGKTRLALEVAKQTRDAYAERVYFVGLADVTSGSLEHIWDVIRDALPIEKQATADPVEQIISFLAQSPALLVLDNLEQLTASGEAAQIISTLRRRITSLACLVTTRNVVGVEGEQRYALGSLIKAGPGTEVEAQPAVQLFIDRARIVYHGFPTTKANLSDILRLCHQLEGIPLAIELAAARANVLTPVQLLTQLKSSFAFLRSRRRDVPERHRSLFAAADSSYRLLSSELQTLFRRLSVFRGGWTLEAAEAVCTSDLDQLTGMDLLDALTELQECSLIVPLFVNDSDDDKTASTEPRFRMLETLREFATDALRSENEQEQIRERHRNFFAAIAQNAEPHLSAGGTDQAGWLDKLETEQDNLLLALETMASRGLQMATHLHRFWFLRGYATEGKRRLTFLLEADADATEMEKAKAHNALGILAWATGDLQQAERQFAQSLELYRLSDDTRTIAGVLNNFGIVASQNGNFDVARVSYTESLALYQSLEDKSRESMVLTNLGGVLIYQENFVDARITLEKALAIQRVREDETTLLQTLQSLADIGRKQHDFTYAALVLRESLSIRSRLRDRNTFGDTVMTAAAILSGWNNPKGAAVLWSAAQALRQQGDITIAPSNENEVNEIQSQIKNTLSDDAFKLFESDGRAMTYEQIITFADQALRGVTK